MCSVNRISDSCSYLESPLIFKDLQNRPAIRQSTTKSCRQCNTDLEDTHSSREKVYLYFASPRASVICTALFLACNTSTVTFHPREYLDGVGILSLFLSIIMSFLFLSFLGLSYKRQTCWSNYWQFLQNLAGSRIGTQTSV